MIVCRTWRLHRIYAFELWADKKKLTLKNWYELASNIPGHNAIVFETCQLEIYEISAFLKATRKLACLAFVFLHEPVVVGVHATYCKLRTKITIWNF